MDRAKHSTDPSDMAMSLRSPSASVRLAALKRLCPCKLRESAGRDEFEPVWDSIFALASDGDARIRAQVSSTNLVTLHTICDGSPSCYEDRVKAALELFNRDADRKIRRQAHKVLASLIRTGKWNVL
ncbi:hypothetical protein FNF29_02876 [Cafeteria roenbergensis]|uniref:Condensin complex subunit 1 C-terminal domain-containing protein n=1 Tax=Cafeteria roenbergensis TaxID=33653 RepID=A0A5A8CMZ4_CAFRO|nr:hypothetical protein FNF29_02876 [Cafeteria roenbergensis]|eukprot:KAA0153887.1 hypothetical protein FNF29_02876 [Cafeteria roenbergensis]